MTTGTNQEHARAHNRSIVLDAIRRAGQITRAELTRLTSLSAQTVSNIIDELQRDGTLLAHAPRRIPHGQPPIPFSLNPDGGFAIGIYMTPHHVTGVLIDLTGQTRSTRVDEVNGHSPANTLSVVKNIVATFQKGLSGKQVFGIGIAEPSQPCHDATAKIHTIAESAWQNGANVAQLEADVGLPVLVQSDAAAAATGEHLYGITKELSDYTYLFIGCELRAVTFLSNELYAGYRDNAGRIGRLVMNSNGSSCHCGKRGCLGRYLSQARFIEYLAIDPRANIDAIDMREYAPGIARFASESSRALHYAMDVLESILDPESVVLGGTVPAAALQALIDQAFPAVLSESGSITSPRTRIKLGAAGGKCVALGAASTVMLTQFAPQYASANARME